MDKKYALIIAFLITGLIISEYYILSENHVSKRESIIVGRVIDGDTLVTSSGEHIRLLNINSPEKNMPNANLSSIFLKNFENSSLEIERTSTDKYGRTLARIYSPDYINLEIVKQGLASKFLVDNDELKEFSSAEDYAIENSLGIWKKSSFYGCIGSSIDEHKEIIILKNKCPDIELTGWYIKDESRKVFKFHNFSLGEVKIHSSNGTDNSTDLFWNQKTAVWNDDRDTMYLFDKEGNIAHYESYGY